MKTLGEINFAAMGKAWESFEAEDWHSADGREGWEAGALAVVLHVLDALAKAGVSAQEAAERLRAGESLEAICDRKPKRSINQSKSKPCRCGALRRHGPFRP